MATSSLLRCLSPSARLILEGASNQRKSMQCFQILRAMSETSRLNIPSDALASFHRDDPYTAVQDDLNHMFRSIRTELKLSDKHLNEIIRFYFDGESKLRAAIIILMAKALNNHVHGYESILLPKQREVAMIAEMLHITGRCHGLTGTLEGSKQASNTFPLAKAMLIGDYIASQGALLLARIRNNEVLDVMSKILGEQVQGEFMQNAGFPSEDNDEKLSRYLTICFNKTGSLIANSCKAVAILAGAEANFQELAFRYGRNVGIASQLIDDASKCDHVDKNQEARIYSHSASKLMNFLPETGDDIENKRFWARQHCAEAVNLLQAIQDSIEKRALLTLTNGFLEKK